MQTFLVTGASGYIASWIVKLLLEKGEKVHGTVRKLSDNKKVSHLQDLQTRYPDQFTLFEADILKKDSLRKAMEGCDIIIHTASPFFITKPKDVQLDLIQPALDGTRNVLTLANEFPKIKKIVVTSSVAAIFGDSADIWGAKEGVFTEQIWNITSDAKHIPYSFSKTLAEKEAWKIAESQKNWELVTINPGFVMGPSLSKRVDSTSIDTMRSLLNGKYKRGVPNLHFGIVDVRDVARAHILAALNEQASGRNICVGTTASILDMANILRAKYPNYPLPKSTVPKFLFYVVGPMMGFSWKYVSRNIGIKIRFDNWKSIKMGVTYRPLETTLSDHAEQLISDKLI